VQTCCKQSNLLRFGRKEVGVSVVSESEVLIMIVILGGDGTGRNNSESHKMKNVGWEMKVKE
jgi:hypothetical protein